MAVQDSQQWPVAVTTAWDSNGTEVLSEIAGVAKINASQLAAMAEALGIPDMTGIDSDKLDVEDKATLAHYLEQQIAKVSTIVDLLLAPSREMLGRTRNQIIGAIPEGASALPHPTFDVKITQRVDRMRDVAMLRDPVRGIVNKVPDDLFQKAVYIKSASLKTADPGLIEQILEAGVPVEWDVDLRQLDKFARQYGGEIGAIIKDATRPVAEGAPVLTIAPRESALKAVS